MQINSFFDKKTATFTYIISDPETNKAAVIDSVLNYDETSGKLSYESATEVINYIKANNLSLEWILETHPHADHLTAASYIKKSLGGKIGIGNQVQKVIDYWAPLFNMPTFKASEYFDQLFDDGETFKLGNLAIHVFQTPGHTPACIAYHVNQSLFVGDALLMPYVGTARADFPGGSAKKLYQSIQKILSQDPDTTIYTCHDYPPQDQQAKSDSTVKEQNEQNIMINQSVSENDFIKKREARDETLGTPKLLLPSLQVNIRAGHLPKPEANGVRYIKIPIDQ